MREWIITNPTDAMMVVMSVIGGYLIVIICIRITGLRSLAKMSATDFVWTIATGSLLATTIISPTPPLLLAAVAFGTVFLLQWLVARFRRRLPWLNRTLNNSPVLLMNGSQILEDNLDRVNVSRDELRAKLREANVMNYQQVKFVIMETTGDISVLHTDEPADHFDEDLLADVTRD